MPPLKTYIFKSHLGSTTEIIIKAYTEDEALKTLAETVLFPENYIKINITLWNR